jgi:isopentenyl-diphosphate delta-isomerase
VVLVNEKAETIGVEEKLKAHQQGLLHKAFSIFILNEKDQMLVQQRAFQKYHFSGLWSNACCSHPMPEEAVEQAAHRRLQEELGFDTECG